MAQTISRWRGRTVNAVVLSLTFIATAVSLWGAREWLAGGWQVAGDGMTMAGWWYLGNQPAGNAVSGAAVAVADDPLGVGAVAGLTPRSQSATRTSRTGRAVWPFSAAPRPFSESWCLPWGSSCRVSSPTPCTFGTWN